MMKREAEEEVPKEAPVTPQVTEETPVTESVTLTPPHPHFGVHHHSPPTKAVEITGNKNYNFLGLVIVHSTCIWNNLNFERLSNFSKKTFKKCYF